MAMRSVPATATGGVALIVACFIGSAALRVTESGAAIAQEIGAMAHSGSAVDAAPTPSGAGGADALLAAIQERSAQLEAEEARLADRAQTLAVAETRLAEQLAALEQARANLEATLAIADQAAERDIDRMTVVYENMKPAEAARIFERMDVTFAAGLLARMRPELAAQVLSGMNADVAYAVTLTIASRNGRAPEN
jgi:flagellar motility protein MotE (MotC chaperone)